ncbi:SPOR domain-containing protein [Pseudomonas sp.]|jgi:DedD protein|uniref:SPOR domain-containing protein n=1 Tax=Pseudomonas sp. TaxID=306 RepID=UPI00272FAD98|nr:SPOR domain-containing protein [Pseudomonas sp.]MDP2243994.1 SPOR domain-containing protein [Pseudomonas sp.]
MALLDNVLKQRIVGALVLVALAVIFLPMLLSREDELQRVVVDAPAMPQAPVMPQIEMQPVVVPEPEVLPEELEPIAEAPAPAEVAPAPVPVPAPVVAPSVPVSAAVQAPASRLDANSLPISWSVQLASLSSRTGAQALQDTLRRQGYDAYVRHVDGMNRVFVGPVIERAEANRLREQLSRQHKLSGFVVRFQPERS